MYQELIQERRKDLDAVFEWAKAELGAIRTGRANPDMVADIQVDYLGTPLRIKEVAAITTPTPRELLIQPWDKQALPGIEKAIRESSLQLAPVVDGTSVRLTVPSLTEERRAEYLKLMGAKIEEARIRIRQIREDILRKIQHAVKEKAARKDDLHKGREALQKVVDEYNGKLEELAGKKERELKQV